VNTHTRLAKKQDGGRLHWIREAINTDPVRECFCLPTNAHTTIFNGSITHSLQISKTTKAFFDHLRIQQQQHVSHSVLNRHNTIKQRKHAINYFTFHHGVVAKKAGRHQQRAYRRAFASPFVGCCKNSYPCKSAPIEPQCVFGSQCKSTGILLRACCSSEKY